MSKKQVNRIRVVALIIIALLAILAWLAITLVLNAQEQLPEVEYRIENGLAVSEWADGRITHEWLPAAGHWRMASYSGPLGDANAALIQEYSRNILVLGDVPTADEIPVEWQSWTVWMVTIQAGLVDEPPTTATPEPTVIPTATPAPTVSPTPTVVPVPDCFGINGLEPCVQPVYVPIVVR